MPDLIGLLDQASEEVLENMFFSGITGELEMPAAGERLRASVAFTGTANGELSVSAPPFAAALLAAGFLGEEPGDVADFQVRAVVGELANVLCGVVLARINPDGQFVITPPRVDVIDTADSAPAGEQAFQRCFELIEGDMTVALTVH